MRYTCVLAYRADCCDVVHINDQQVDAADAKSAAAAAYRALLADIPSAEVISDEIVVIKGAHSLLGVYSTEISGRVIGGE